MLFPRTRRRDDADLEQLRNELRSGAYDTDALDRLMAAVTEQTTKDLLGVSDAAWEALRERLDRLSRATRADLGIHRDRQEDGHGTVASAADERTDASAGFSESLRTSARTVAAVMAPEDADPALFLHETTRNPHLTPADWEEALVPAKNQLDVDELREIAALLRTGATIREVVEATGQSQLQVDRVSALLGRNAWLEERRLRLLCDLAEAGWGMHDAWAEWDRRSGEPRRSDKQRRRVWAEVEAICATVPG